MINQTAFEDQVVPAVIRELDRRRSFGIEVALLWNPRTDHVFISVVDEVCSSPSSSELPRGTRSRRSNIPTCSRRSRSTPPNARRERRRVVAGSPLLFPPRPGLATVRLLWKIWRQEAVA